MIGFEPIHPGSVLDVLAQSIGSIPRVLLPGTQPDDRGVAVIKPSSPEMPALAERGDRYRLFGEIARGGMGRLSRAAMPTWAVTWPSRSCSKRIPISPICYGVSSRRPRLAGNQTPGERGRVMPRVQPSRLWANGVAGNSRRAGRAPRVQPSRLPVLTQRSRHQTPGHRARGDLPRLLAILEQVAQTVAYAHARNVIHRDLELSNVMVGSFGEVQVMDWGLAKVLREGGGDDEHPVDSVPQLSMIATVRSGSDVDESQVGSVLGTPAYMAPEQAGGDVERVDRRADVLGLGSILCEILTGQPAYIGRTSDDRRRRPGAGTIARGPEKWDPKLPSRQPAATGPCFGAGRREHLRAAAAIRGAPGRVLREKIPKPSRTLPKQNERSGMRFGKMSVLS